MKKETGNQKIKREIKKKYFGLIKEGVDVSCANDSKMTRHIRAVLKSELGSVKNTVPRSNNKAQINVKSSRNVNCTAAA